MSATVEDGIYGRTYPEPFDPGPAHNPTMPDDDGPRRRVILTPASAFKVRRVHWLWEGRMAIGTLALLAGREGQGKSTLAYWIASRVSRGELPGEFHGTPKSVLVCATEDSWEHTIVPRLIAAGADLDRVFCVEVMTDHVHVGLSLPRDLGEVRDKADAADAAFLILDPLTSRLGKLDTHKDAEVRQALEPLAAAADDLNLTVLGLMHHNKNGSGDPLEAVMASKAFTAVARSVSTVVPDPDDEDDQVKLFGTPKNNLGTTNLPTLAFTVESVGVETEDDGTAYTGRIRWGDERTESIREVMGRATTDPEQRTAATEAADWLTDYLAQNGGQAPSKDAKTAGKAAGHSEAALHRARKKLRLEVTSGGFPRQSYWEWPTPPVVSPQSLPPVVSPLGESE